MLGARVSQGNFERAISIHRTSYSVVTQSRYAHHTPATAAVVTAFLTSQNRAAHSLFVLCRSAHLPNMVGGLVWMAQVSSLAMEPSSVALNR